MFLFFCFLFWHFLFFSFRSRFFQDFSVALQQVLALPSSDIKWCDINGEPLSFVGPTVSAALVSKDPSLANLAHLRFRHPDYFRAGSLHDHVDFWEDLISSTGYTCFQIDLLRIIREGVRVNDFFRHFKGNFKGKHYDSAVPPVSSFPNSPCCHQFTDFIDTTVLAWVSQGVVKVYSRVGVCSPPHLVLPLTVEPSKPRLCHDERFLNRWIRDLPFKLAHLPDLPRYVLPGHFQTTFDDKSGYQHLKIHPNLVRDVTFFVVDFYTGDRASDLGRLKADQLFRRKDREGFLLNFTFSKTRRAGQSRPFALLYVSQTYPPARCLGLITILQHVGR